MTKADTKQNTVNATNEQLKTIVSRIERLEEDKKALSLDITEVLNEAKANGYDVKAIRAILKIRKTPAAELQELEHIVDLYKHALGMI